MRSIAIMCLILLLASAHAFAQDIEVPSPSSAEAAPVAQEREGEPDGIPVASEAAQLSLLEEKDHIYSFPDIDPHFGLALGGRYTNVDGPEWLSDAEYEYTHDSLTFGGNVTAFPFPHRIHLEMEYLNKKDYYGDASYAYGDVFLFRWINNTVFHNLENVTLLNPGNDPTYSVNIFDQSEDYGKRTGINRFALRYKTHDFPLHVYALGDWIYSDGSQQQRFLGGSGFFNDLVRTSEKRDIDWDVKDITVGLNSHLGPVEIDYGHSERRFRVGDGDMSYTYAAGAGRPAGTYRHNLIPETKRSTDALKIHTSYTGRFVVSGSIVSADGENESNGAQADYFTGSAEARWLPMHAVTITARYRHHEKDLDNPSEVTLTDLSDPTNSQTYSVRDSISSTTDSVSSAIRVRLSKKVTLNAEYTHKNIDRENADEWALASTTTKDKVLLRVRVRPLKTLTMKATYAHEAVDAPAFNTEMDDIDRAGIAATWIPLPDVTMYLEYDYSSGNRDDLAYTVDDQLVSGGSRDTKATRLIGMVGFSPARDIAVSASYAFFESKVNQDLLYATFAATPIALVDSNVLYREKAHVIGTTVRYTPKKILGFGAGISHTWSKQNFFPNESSAQEPMSISSFSEHKSTETVYSVDGQYEFLPGVNAEIRYRYSDFNDSDDNPYDSIADQDSHILVATISKRW